MGAVELQSLALWLVRGAVALVQLLLAVPGHADWHPVVGAQFPEAVLDRAIRPDPVACVVVAERLLDFRAFFKFWGRFGFRAVLVAGGRMMRMLGPGALAVVAGGRMMRMLGPGWSGGSGRVSHSGRKPRTSWTP